MTTYSLIFHVFSYFFLCALLGCIMLYQAYGCKERTKHRVVNQTREKFLYLSFNWNHFEMRLLNLRLNFLFIADFLSSSRYFFFFYYILAKFHHWPSSGFLPRPQIGMLSLVTVSPVVVYHTTFLTK